MKNIKSKEIEFGHNTTGKSNQEVNLSLQLRSHKERFKAYTMTILKYNIVFGFDWH